MAVLAIGALALAIGDHWPRGGSCRHRCWGGTGAGGAAGAASASSPTAASTARPAAIPAPTIGTPCGRRSAGLSGAPAGRGRRRDDTAPPGGFQIPIESTYTPLIVPSSREQKILIAAGGFHRGILGREHTVGVVHISTPQTVPGRVGRLAPGHVNGSRIIGHDGQIRWWRRRASSRDNPGDHPGKSLACSVPRLNGQEVVVARVETINVSRGPRERAPRDVGAVFRFVPVQHVVLDDRVSIGPSRRIPGDVEPGGSGPDKHILGSGGRLGMGCRGQHGRPVSLDIVSSTGADLDFVDPAVDWPRRVPSSRIDTSRGEIGNAPLNPRGDIVAVGSID